MNFFKGRNSSASCKKKSVSKSTGRNVNQATGTNLTLICLSVVFGALLRFILALHPHSGEGIPPMFGDYEAQRHWMEITVNLLPTEWYRNSTNNDLLYWGLDYPPLTAYHSYAIGKLANSINSSYVALHSSRGLETVDHKRFMRYTVLVSDFVTYFPAVIFYFYKFFRKEQTLQSSQFSCVVLSLIYPGLILIDHGHFQYNCVSLGLTVFAIVFILYDHIYLSAVFFSLALNYKQMSLYHALPFFVYMLRISLGQNGLLKKLFFLLKLGTIVIATFVLVWLPFLLNGRSTLDVLIRIFPVGRGIFEDKVANVWCAINVIYKLKNISAELLLRLCMIATLSFSLPSLVSLFKTPTHIQFLLSLINVSLAFFLFSFQVHEKSILLVALPVLLYAPYDPLPSAWFLMLSSFSLMHLAFKDNLVLPFIALHAIFLVYISYSDWYKAVKNGWIFWLIHSSFLGAILIFFGFCYIEPPTTLPDLWPLLTAIFYASHFALFLLYFNFSQLFNSEG